MDTALLHVDPYNNFISPQGKVWSLTRSRIEWTGLTEYTKHILEAARAHDVLRVILPHKRWTAEMLDRWEFLSPTQQSSARARQFDLGTWGGMFRDGFTPRAGGLVCSEHWSASGFANTDLNLPLRQRGIRRVAIIGLRANTCIDSTARWAHKLGYHVTIVSDAIGAFSAEEVREMLEVNAPAYASNIVSIQG